MKKLNAVRSELTVPKNQYNSFGKYNYRSCEDIVEAVKPLLQVHDLFLTISDEIIQVGNRIYVKASATITDGETSVTSTAYAREPETKKGMDESQITGTASSYARKYALNALFLIDDTKDADTNEHHAEQKKETPDDNTDILARLNSSALSDKNILLAKYHAITDLKAKIAYSKFIEQRLSHG